MDTNSGLSIRRLSWKTTTPLGLFVLAAAWMLVTAPIARGHELLEGLSATVEEITDGVEEAATTDEPVVDVSIGPVEASLGLDETTIDLGVAEVDSGVLDSTASVSLGEEELSIDLKPEDNPAQSTSSNEVVPRVVTTGRVIIEPLEPPGLIPSTGSTLAQPTDSETGEVTSTSFGPEQLKEPSLVRAVAPVDSSSTWLADILTFASNVRFVLSELWSGSLPLGLLATLALLGALVSDLGRKLISARDGAQETRLLALTRDISSRPSGNVS